LCNLKTGPEYGGGPQSSHLRTPRAGRRCPQCPHPNAIPQDALLGGSQPSARWCSPDFDEYSVLLKACSALTLGGSRRLSPELSPSLGWALELSFLISLALGQRNWLPRTCRILKSRPSVISLRNFGTIVTSRVNRLSTWKRAGPQQEWMANRMTEWMTQRQQRGPRLQGCQAAASLVRTGCEADVPRTLDSVNDHWEWIENLQALKETHNVIF
jgi:hypothetical protein